MTEQRLICRMLLVEQGSDRVQDLRVQANNHGLLNIYLTGIARDLSYAGIDEDKLPASVAQGGGSNKAVTAAIRAAIRLRMQIKELWIEPEPT